MLSLKSKIFIYASEGDAKFQKWLIKLGTQPNY